MSETMIYCPNCDYELSIGAASVSPCPECGHSLRTWDTGDGTRPGKRPFNEEQLSIRGNPNLPAKLI